MDLDMLDDENDDENDYHDANDENEPPEDSVPTTQKQLPLNFQSLMTDGCLSL
jgi:hypothetical protein